VLRSRITGKLKIKLNLGFDQPNGFLSAKVCHNPIFTPEIFSGVDTQNGAARGEPVRPDRDPPQQKNLKTRSEEHFLEFGEV
jgi:hypothetical protein